MLACNNLVPKILLTLCLCFTQTCFAFQQALTFLAEELPPYSFINEQGNPDGAFVEIISALLKQAKIPGEIKIQPLARSIQTMKIKANTFMFSFLRTKNRENNFRWVGKIYQTHAALIGLKGRDDIELSSLKEAKSFTVGTIRGYHSADFLQKNGFREYDNLSLSVTSKHMWAMLFNQRIDLVLTNYMALDRDIKKSGFDAQSISPYLSLTNFPNELYIATGLTTANDIVQQLSQALSEIKASGIHQKILTKYNL